MRILVTEIFHCHCAFAVIGRDREFAFLIRLGSFSPGYSRNIHLIAANARLAEMWG